TVKVIGASYSMPLAERDNIKARSVCESATFKRLFPEAVPHQDIENRRNKFITHAGGHRMAVSIDGGGLLGSRADIAIGDDLNDSVYMGSKEYAQKVIDFWQSKMRSRFNRRNPIRIVCQQRLAANDISGYLLENAPSYKQVKIQYLGTDDKPINDRVNLGELL